MSNHAQLVVAMWFLATFFAVITGGAIYLWVDSVRVDRRNLIARADRQHRQCLADDPRGIYGDYPPAALADYCQPGPPPVTYETIWG